MQENEPFVFVHPRTGHTAIVCFTAKAGSTAWYNLLARPRVVAPRHDLLGATHLKQRDWPLGYSSPYRNKTTSFLFTRASTADLLANRSVPRLRVVRNPFTRLLSGYLDKLVLTNRSTSYERWLAHAVAPAGFSPHSASRHAAANTSDGSFGDFVNRLTTSHRPPNFHFKLQSTVTAHTQCTHSPLLHPCTLLTAACALRCYRSSTCKLPGGAEWDFELKVASHTAALHDCISCGCTPH
jgi:hypothetical protein